MSRPPSSAAAASTARSGPSGRDRSTARWPAAPPAVPLRKAGGAAVHQAPVDDVVVAVEGAPEAAGGEGEAALGLRELPVEGRRPRRLVDQVFDGAGGEAQPGVIVEHRHAAARLEPRV